MARPTHAGILSGTQGWDGDIDDNFDIAFDAPYPVHEHTGDESDLNATFAASSHDRCLVWVDHTTLGWTLYWSDGSNWRPFSHEVRDFTNITGIATLSGRERVVLLAGSPAYTVTLAPAADWAGETVDFKLTVGGGTVTLDGSGAETIDGAATYTGLSTQYDTVRLYSDGTNIHILSK
jgi:hypothetical protein